MAFAEPESLAFDFASPEPESEPELELSEEDFRGELLKDHPRDIRGDNDVLGLTRPDIVESIHRDYLAAGAWILSTNTFNGSPVSQAEYGLEHLVYDMNRAAAENARRALDGAEDRFVVGSLGPTNRTLSISPKVEDPAFRTITFDELTEAYAEQIRGLADGGVDILQIETIFDTLNAKAAIAAAQDIAPDLPLWLSFTAVDPAADAVVFTVAGSHGTLDDSELTSKLTPFDQYPRKGRATGGVRCQRFLKGEDVLVFAWAGGLPARAAQKSGAPAVLPAPDPRRDGSGTPLVGPVAVIAGPL